MALPSDAVLLVKVLLMMVGMSENVDKYKPPPWFRAALFEKVLLLMMDRVPCRKYKPLA